MIDLAAILARTNAATPGPWEAGMDTHGLPDGGPTFVAVRDAWYLVIAELDLSQDGGQDAEFIAHARTDVPALVAEVQRLRMPAREASQVIISAEGVRQERDDLIAVMQAVLDLHWWMPTHNECWACEVPYPCATIRAIEGPGKES